MNHWTYRRGSMMKFKGMQAKKENYAWAKSSIKNEIS